MGIEDEKIDEIISMHTDTVDGLKDQVKTYEADAKKLPTVQKELDELKAAGDGGYKEKYEKEHKAFEDFRKEREAKDTRAAKEQAVMEYLKSKNVQDANLKLALRSLSAEIDEAELENGKLKDSKAFDDLLSGELSGLVTTTTEKGTGNPANPPANNGKTMTKADIYKKDDKGRYVMSAAERQKALMENQIT
jgi:hypothetical protein